MAAYPLFIALAGPALLIVYFTLAYIAVATACAGVWPLPVAFVASAVLTAATTLAVAWLIWESWRLNLRAPEFTPRFGLVLNGLSLVSTLWIGVAMLASSC